MELTGWLVLAAAVTVTGVAVLVVTDRRRTHAWRLPVLWTAGLALLTGLAFLWIGGGLAWGVAAPGIVIWLATIATGGRPGVLVDPPPSGDPGSRSQSRLARQHSRGARLYLLLVLLAAVVVLALVMAGATGHLPWSS